MSKIICSVCERSIAKSCGGCGGYTCKYCGATYYADGHLRTGPCEAYLALESMQKDVKELKRHQLWNMYHDRQVD